MADWSSRNITLTTKGASALSKVQAGSGSLTITRVVASEQYVAESMLREVTSLSSENLPLTIIDRHEVQDGGSVIQVQLSNLYLGKAFTFNEIGVFATHSDNPSEEFLYIIAQVDAETGDKIPLYSTTPITATYDIYLYNVGADNVEITISSAGLVTYETLNKVCDIIQRNTAYEVGDILHNRSLKKGLAIKCTVAGITKSTDTDLSHKEVGDTVEDGTSQWIVIAPFTTADFDAHNHSLDAHPELVKLLMESGLNVIKRSHSYAKGDIAYSDKIPSWAFLECIVAGTTSDGWYFPKPSEIKVNDTIVDYTVTWKVRKVADTASKLATARNIALTGNATGSAAFDGSGDININTTVNESKHAAAANAATKLQTARIINFNGALDGNVTFDGSKDVSVTLSEFNHIETIIDLTDATKYDTDTYYPVVSDAYWSGKEHKYCCWTPIHSVETAPWGTFGDGGVGDYSAELKVRNNMGSWGAVKSYAEILTNSCLYTTNGKMPITYEQMENCGRSVFFVRGGGKYWFSSSRNATWELKIDTFTENGNTVAPTKTYFTPESRNTIKTLGINISGNADKATADANGRAFTDTNAYMHISALADNTDFNNVKTTGIYYCTGNTYSNSPHNSRGILTVYSIGTVKQEYRPNNAAVYYTREYNNANWTAWSKVAASTADSATNATNANRLSSESGNNYLNIDTTTDSWSVIGSNPGNWLKSIRMNQNAPAYSIGNFSAAIAFGGDDTKGIITHAYDGPTVKFAGGNGLTAGWKFSIYGGRNNETYNLNNFPTKTGGGASGTWGINIRGNANTVDGYHASDLLRTLGGNRTPVITDIFDRAGTIDMSTMSAADKATHKANINKAPNMTQNIWNNSTGFHAYGGDTDISGYKRGTLKLTQSWRNFDRLMILYTDDDSNWGRVRTFDVYEFNYCMTNMHSFNLFMGDGIFWHVYGFTKHGTDSDFKPSTETILSCRDQNSGLIGIYGIKF